jgi:APA family basic amino acid/polyamine antiporter
VLQVVGALGCLVLVSTLPPTSIIVGLGVLVVGALYRWVRLRLANRNRSATSR